jgi:hypothetical protein
MRMAFGSRIAALIVALCTTLLNYGIAAVNCANVSGRAPTIAGDFTWTIASHLPEICGLVAASPLAQSAPTAEFSVNRLSLERNSTLLSGVLALHRI